MRERMELMKIWVDKKELRKFMKSLDRGKAPGPDDTYVRRRDKMQ